LKFLRDLRAAFSSLYSSIPGMQVGRKEKYIGWLAAGIAAILFYLSVRGINWGESLQTIKEGHYGYLPVLLIWASVTDIFRAVRWRILLQADRRIKLTPVFWANMVGYFGNMTLPARAGEALRSVYVGRELNMSTSFAFATCLVERVIDLIILVLIGSMAILSIGNSSPLLLNAIIVMALLGFLALIFIILLPSVKGTVSNLVRKISMPVKTRDLILAFIENFSYGFSALRDRKRMAAFLGMSGIIWLSDTLWYMLAGFMFNIQMPLILAFGLVAMLGLSSAIPSTPGYFGVHQFVAVIILTPFGFPQGGVVAYITAVQVINILQISFWGVIGILRFAKISNLPYPAKG